MTESQFDSLTEAIRSGRPPGDKPNPNSGLARPGGTHPAEGEPKVTIASLSEAIRNNPQNPLSYISRALLHREQGDLDRAIADYSQVIKLDPSPASADILLMRADLYEEKGEFPRAIADYTAVLRWTPKDGDTLGRRCYARAAANRELTQAVGDCNQAIASVDTRPEYFMFRGFVLIRQGRFAEAIEDFDLAGEEADSVYLRGIAKLRRGKKQEGNDDIEFAKALDPDIAQKYARMGVRP